VNEVLEIVGQVAGTRLDIRREAPQKGDMRNTFADTTRARTDMDFRPTATLADGLRAEYEWLRSVTR
jgi:UDP-glucose 4-epimerase